MASIQSWTHRHLTTLLLLLLAGGFAVILGELILYEHYDGAQLIGFISTLLGLVIVLWGILAQNRVRVVLAAFLLLLSVTGLIGVIQHSGDNDGDEERERRALAAAVADVDAANAQSILYVDADNDSAQLRSDDRSDSGDSAPPLAPLGLSGLALMGATLLIAKRDPVRTEPGAQVAPAA